MSFGQGGPGRGPESSSTPDWSALAEEAEQSRGRRRRWMFLGGGGLAAVVVAAIVAVTLTGGGNSKSADDKNLPSEKDLGTAQPEPTFKDSPPPPPPPADFLADAKSDTAPVSARSLFPGDEARINGRVYKKAATRTSKCAGAAHAGLGPVLKKHGCRSLHRATYTRGGLAVTVGVAVFEDVSRAKQVRAGYKPNIVALPGKGVPDFCRTVECRTTVNSLGRYALFTISGRTNGKKSDESDTAAEQAGRDGSAYAYTRVMERGEEEARKYAESAAAD